VRRFPGVMVVEFFLVAPNLAVQLVHQFVQGRPEVVPYRFGVKAPLAQMNGSLGLVMRFLRGQYAVNLRYPAEMPLDAFELVAGVFSGVRCDLKMVATQVKLHAVSPSPQGKMFSFHYARAGAG